MSGTQGNWEQAKTVHLQAWPRIPFGILYVRELFPWRRLQDGDSSPCWAAGGSWKELTIPGKKRNNSWKKLIIRKKSLRLPPHLALHCPGCLLPPLLCQLIQASEFNNKRTKWSHFRKMKCYLPVTISGCRLHTPTTQWMAWMPLSLSSQQSKQFFCQSDTHYFSPFVTLNSGCSKIKLQKNVWCIHC